MSEVEMRKMVRWSYGIIVALVAACGSDSTGPSSMLNLHSVDGLAIPAVVSTSGGFQWSIVSGTLDKNTCAYDIMIMRSGSSNLYESTGSASCAQSGTATSFTASISFTPSLGSHAYSFVP
jgi:hypothetical protein